MLDNKELLSRIKKLIGVPYLHLGRLEVLPESSSEILKLKENDSGLDCLGLLILIYKNLGYDIPDYAKVLYEKDWHKTKRNAYLEGFKKFFEKVDDLKVWDALMFRIRTGDHTGVYLGNGSFIHSLRNNAVMITEFGGFWENVCYGFYRARS